MRTVRIEHEMHIGSGSVITVSTEVIIGNDDEAEERGAEAQEFLNRFIAGMTSTAT